MLSRNKEKTLFGSRYIPLFPIEIIEINHYSNRHQCFTGKRITRKVHTKLHRGNDWRTSHMLISDDIDDIISRFFTFVFAEGQSVYKIRVL